MRRHLSVAIFLFVWFCATLLSWSLFASYTGYPKLNQGERAHLFYSETALYYSFYHNLVSVPNFSSGLHNLQTLTDIEHPHPVNALKTHNALPEVILSGAYKAISSLGISLDPLNFYLAAVYFIGGLSLAMIFLISSRLFNSYLSGLLPVFLFISSWPFSTRIIYYPGLRENFAIPALLVTLSLLYDFLTSPKLKLSKLFFALLLSLFQLLSWQMSRYTLATLFLSAFVLFLTDRPKYKSKFILAGGSIGLLILTVLIWQNQGSTADHNHLTRYFLFRLGNLKPDFHAALYWCSQAYHNLNLYQLQLLIKNLLIVIIFAIASFLWRQKELRYWLAVAVIFSLMAVLVNRLLVLAVPALCLLAGSLMQSKHARLWSHWWRPAWGIFLLLSFMLFTYPRLSSSLSYRLHLNPSQLELANWINQHTSSDAVLAGNMETTSILHLTTLRPIANNPYYESASSRAQNFMAYQMYNQISEQNYASFLKESKVNYFIVNNWICTLPPSDSCGPEGLFAHETKDVSLPTLCRSLTAQSQAFTQVFSNQDYAVYQVN